MLIIEPLNTLKKNVPGFYTSRDSWNNNPNHVTGWDFRGNPLVLYTKTATYSKDMYVDYLNSEKMNQLKEDISFKFQARNYFMFISFFESQKAYGE